MTHHDLDQVIEQRVRERRGHRVWATIREGAVIVSVAIVIWVLITVRLNQASIQSGVDQTHQTAQSAKHAAQSAKQAAYAAQESTAILTDCLTPGGKCYERNKGNTAAILTDITKRFEFVVICGRDPALTHNYPGFNACVTRMTKEHGL